MARKLRSNRLENRTNRLKLPVQGKPHDFTAIERGLAVGYRRNRTDGTWVARRSNDWTKAIGLADDYQEADGERVLTWFQAIDKARKLVHGDAKADKPPTVDDGLTDYEADLVATGGNPQNATSPRYHLPAALLAKPIALTTGDDWRRWRNKLIADGMKPQTFARMAKGLNAALNVQKRRDPKLVNTWSAGLTLHDTYVAREAGLSDQQVVAIVAESGGIDPAFGLYVETHAVTGARTSQIAKLKVVDLQHADSATPRLMMPSSVKGRGRRQVRHVPVPITPALARKLKAAAAGRGPNEPLLLRADGEPWRPRSADHRLLFMEAAKRAGAPAATMIWLRHSSIIRALIAGTPTRVVAANHDTSTVMLERTYSRFISDHADQVARRGLLLIPEAAPENVVRLGGRT